MPNGTTQAPAYPAPIGPSLASISERHRMQIEDALAAREAQESRQLAVAEQGAKAAYEYDDYLRGFMEAKYSNPELTFWDYVSNPSVGGAYRAEGKKKILEHIKGGGDVKDIPGMTFRGRHKGGLKRIFGKDEQKAPIKPGAKQPVTPAVTPTGAAGQVTAKQPPGVPIKFITPGAKYTDIQPDWLLEEVNEGGLVAAGNPNKGGIYYVDPKSGAKYDYFGYEAGSVAKKNIVGEIDLAKSPVVSKPVTTPVKPVTTPVKPATLPATLPATDTASSVGLKEVLGTAGTVAKGVGYGASIVSGAQRLAKGGTAKERIGGTMQTVGGIAGIVAMTNFWNPVGWAAAVPAALSIGGGILGAGGGIDPLAGTPLGKYRRRVGIS